MTTSDAHPRPATEAIGFYGKLPLLGDFVQRRLPAEFVQPWDQWLQEALAQSRDQLGDAWLEHYLISPLWRFVLSPGIAGQSCWAGVMMPSVDRVGRYFPLTLARALSPATDCFTLLCEHSWLEQLEGLALSTLEEGFSLDAFDAAVAALPAPPTTERQWRRTAGERADAWQLPAPSAADLSGCAGAVLQRALDDAFLAYSHWWTAGSEQVEASLLTCQGLPPADAFAAMLAGDWAAARWSQLETH